MSSTWPLRNPPGCLRKCGLTLRPSLTAAVVLLAAIRPASRTMPTTGCYNYRSNTPYRLGGACSLLVALLCGNVARTAIRPGCGAFGAASKRPLVETRLALLRQAFGRDKLLALPCNVKNKKGNDMNHTVSLTLNVDI